VSSCKALCYVSYKDSEVAWRAGDVSGRRQGLRDVLHTEGCGQDPEGQPNHQITLRAFERPAVTGVHIGLRRGSESRNHNGNKDLRMSVSTKQFYFQQLHYNNRTFL